MFREGWSEGSVGGVYAAYSGVEKRWAIHLKRECLGCMGYSCD